MPYAPQSTPKGAYSNFTMGPRGSTRKRVAVTRVADCTAKFALAQRNPFVAYYSNISEVCMPDSVVLPTEKGRLITKGSGATGTTGYGFVIGNPYCVTNDGAPMAATSGASIMAAATVINTVAANVSSYNESAYTNADLGANNVEYRICGYGLRVRYTGTQDTMGGTVYAYRSPSNTDIGGETFNSISPLPETQRYPLSRDWVTIVWKLASPTDMDFATSTGGVYTMGLLIQSPNAAQTFDYEAVVFYELVGQNVPQKTKSDSDPTGFGAVQAVGTATQDSFKGSGPSMGHLKEKICQEAKRTTTCAFDLAADIGSFAKAAGAGITAGGVASMIRSLYNRATPAVKRQIAQQLVKIGSPAKTAKFRHSGFKKTP